MKHQLDFEKPIIELENKLEELKTHPEEHAVNVNFENEIRVIEEKIAETRKQIFLNLNAWQRVQMARHPKRPFTLDYLKHTFTDFSELHGDRLFAEDRAMVGGFARLGSQRVIVIGTQKGRDTKENILRNFGSAHPEGYRKALRLMKLADKFGLPIITIIDTAGAYPGIGSEERHVGEAIAVNLREMMLLQVPVIAVVIGEGGSGGALGIGVADRVLIFENAYYSVISPEGCAAILWKDRKASAQAAEALKITAKDLLGLKLVDEIVPEPLGGAHNDPVATAANLKQVLLNHLDELNALPVADRLKTRYAKFRTHGHFTEKASASLLKTPRKKTTSFSRVRSLARPGNRFIVKLYPLIFRPIFKERVWGGRQLESFFLKPLPAGPPIGESWEISDRPGAVSVIANGELAGKDLHWLMEHCYDELLGTACVLEDRFPLLCKILDAKDKLSLQVHPPAKLAHQLGGEPKTEMWYFTHTEPWAEVYAGLKRGVTRAMFEQKIKTSEVGQCFHRIPVRTGDALFLPSGRVHAVGAGNLIFEIQQNSDTTYRVFDWNRTGLDGKSRELHVEQALASIDFNDFEPSLVEGIITPGPNYTTRLLVNDPLFMITEITLRKDDYLLPKLLKPQIIAVVQGSLSVHTARHLLELQRGQFCLIPAELHTARLTAITPAKLLYVDVA